MKLLSRVLRAIEEGPPWPPAGAGGDAPAAIVRRAAHRASVSRFPTGTGLLASAVKAAAWPAWSLLGAARFARYRAGGVREFLDIWWTAIRYCAPPLEQYAYRIPPRLSAEAHRWMYHGEIRHLNVALADAEAVRLCSDKARFAGHLSRAGQPVAETLALVEPGSAVRPDRSRGSLVVKPNSAFAGAGLEIWSPAREEGVWERRSREPERLDEDRLGTLISQLASQYGAMLVQPLIPPHPRLAVQGAIIPPVLRIISGQWPEGEVGLAYALMWYQIPEVGREKPLGFGVVDLDRGGLFSTTAQETPVFPWMAPLKLVASLDGPLPDWDATKEAVMAAHAALPGRIPMLAWDVIPSPDGPVILEANVGCTLYFHQLATGRPGSETILGDVFSAWLARSARGGGGTGA